MASRMEFKKFSNGVAVPVVGIGTWHMGGEWNMPDRSNDKAEITAIKASIEMGMTHIDTAEGYGGGHAEELVAKAIEGFERDKFFITTKVSGDHLSYENVIKSAEASLRRLKTDYVDLYLIHWPNHRIKMENTMKAMDFLVKEGLVKSIGVSNFSVPDMKEAQKNSENKIMANQIEYNLLTRNSGQFTDKMESEIIPFCQKNNIMITAYRPTAFGRIIKTKSSVLDDICKKYSKTRVQIAINWLISKSGIITISKSSSIEHLKEIRESIGWEMNKEDYKELDDLSV